MTFIWPLMLLGLFLIPMFVGVYLRQQARRRQLVHSYGSFGALPDSLSRSLGVRRHIPPVLFLLALAILIVALARPQAQVSWPRVEGTVILAFDVSGSMAADDIQPTRMEAAKAAATSFVKNQPCNILVGVVAFSDNGFIVQPPTDDEAAILATINRLAPQRGTSLGQGILASLNVLTAGEEIPEHYSDRTPEPTATPTPLPRGVYSPAVIVLLSDGENTVSPDPLAVAQLAVDRGVKIHTIGIGSPTGANIEVEGFTIHSQLNEIALKQISALTDGTYYQAGNAQELQSIYANLNPQLVVKPEHIEITALLAGLGILILLGGGALSLAWFSRLP
jgi:Ca-activated chloride channel family protein